MRRSSDWSYSTRSRRGSSSCATSPGSRLPIRPPRSGYHPPRPNETGSLRARGSAGSSRRETAPSGCRTAAVSLTPERWRAARAVLGAALERAPDERSALVNEACGADVELRAEVETMLAAAGRADGSLGVPNAFRTEALEAAGATPNVTARLASALRGRYVVERELGAGGMATVYLARDLRHRRPVALKVLHPDLGVLVGPRRFRREIETAANLSHPHILPLFDSGEAEGLIYYTMPYVAGETLRARLLRDGALPIPAAVSVVRDVAKALAYAHKHGVVHRDIKPANILIDDGHALVADFGIARAVHQAQEQEAADPLQNQQRAAAETLTRTGNSPGTPGYMAPE